MNYYQQLVDDYDLLYAFVYHCACYEECMDAICKADARAGALIERWWIGDRINEDGTYDLASGQLLGNIPPKILGQAPILPKAYQAAIALAEAYASFVVNFSTLPPAKQLLRKVSKKFIQTMAPR